jgi:hypothetical protein
MLRHVLVALVLAAAATARAQDAGGLPEAVLLPAPPITFPAEVDSNSPAFWADGRLHVFNSLHHPFLSEGRSVGRLDDPVGVVFQGGVVGPRWMESVIQHEDGTLYGFYHHEPVGLCNGAGKTAPRIGAARSRDGGFGWDDLGIILAAPSSAQRCVTENLYFVGGEGDFSAVLDPERNFVYFVFSAYPNAVENQGIAVARMAWADRDRPAGRVMKWRDGEWTTPGLGGRATPIYGVSASWHEGGTDAFWGPSLHWNTALQKYVILMTRARDSDFANEGIYVAYADRLDDPSSWSTPRRLLQGGAWYPQIMGLARGQGTDALAGEYARFFMGGRSDHFIRFDAKPASSAASQARKRTQGTRLE